MTLQLPLGSLEVERPHAVSAVVAAARQALEAVFRLLWVEGEIADLKRYPSGLWYFSLRDRDAQLRSVVFRFEARKLSRTVAGLAEGTQVFVRGDLSVGKRGELQLLVRELLPRPEGGFHQLQLEKARAALESALGRAAGHTVDAAGFRLSRAATRVDRAVALRLAGVAQRLDRFAHRMDARVAARIEQGRSALRSAAASLEALSPLTVLARGYSVARDAGGNVIHSTADLRPGTRFRLRVVDGEVRAVVEPEA